MTKAIKAEVATYTVTAFNTEKQIVTALGLLANDALSLRDRIQSVGLAIITLWGKKKIEPSRAAELFNMLTQVSPYHAKAVVAWVVMFTPLQWAKESKSLFAHAGDRVNGDNYKEARTSPFWAVSKPADPAPFDALTAIEKLLERNSKRIKDAKEGDVCLPASATNAIREALKALKAEA